MLQTRVLIADDHPAILEEVRRSLDGDFAVVGAVENGQDALDSVLSLNPVVLVTDISMPILDGLQVASALRIAASRTKIVFLTCHADRAYVEAALSVGAHGYVTKPRIFTDLVPAIHQALMGHGPSELMKMIAAKPYTSTEPRP
ncbi:MAG: response regulator transcription factor [Bryobacteraceae bacterium]